MEGFACLAADTVVYIMKHIRRAAFIFWLLITGLPILGVIASITFPDSFLSTQEQFRSYAAKSGAFAPIPFIALQALQVIITPISHYSVGYLGGFLFGPVWGTIYNYTGRIIGHITAYFIARRLILPAARRYVPVDTLETYNNAVSTRADLLFLMYFLPLFPDDELSYLAGLSKMPFFHFLLANVFGQIGGSLGLAYLGAGIDTKDPVFQIFIAATLLGFPVLWVLGRKARNAET